MFQKKRPNLFFFFFYMCNTDAKGFKLDKFLGNLQVCGIVEIPLHHSLIIINLKLNLSLIEFSPCSLIAQVMLVLRKIVVGSMAITVILLAEVIVSVNWYDKLIYWKADT